MFWIKFWTMAKQSSGYRCFGAFWSANNWPWPWLCTTDLASYLLTKWQLWQFWQFTLKWLSGAPTQDKTKEFFSCFFFFFSKILFNYAIQEKFITWPVNSALNCTWKPILHSSYRFSRAELPRLEMNFSIKLPLNILPFYKRCPDFLSNAKQVWTKLVFLIITDQFKKYHNCLYSTSFPCLFGHVTILRNRVV
mgnify:CR=1 FL=1